MGIDHHILVSVGVPDRLDTAIGNFTFADGVPTPDSLDRLYDSLDLIRAVEAYLTSIPGASLSAMRAGQRSVGITSSQVIGITDPRANSGSVYLTPNTDTVYATTFLDLAETGPTVIEAPPNSLNVVDDFWFRYVTDMGIPGEDRGAGGKYLIVPPGYDGDLPDDGYYIRFTSTYTNWVVFRALDGVPAIKTIRVYPLAEADNPPEMTFLNLAPVPHNTVHANDATFYDEIKQIIQEEPPEFLDPETRGLLASIGIVKGQPFEPDQRMRDILAKAAPLASGIARALVFRPRDRRAYYYENSSWKNAFIGGRYDFEINGVRLLDARTMFHYMATVITPAMAAAQVGAGSQYAFTAEDSAGAWLDGGRDYVLHLPPQIPAKNFWSVCVYDTQTRSLLVTDNPYPSVSSLSPDVRANDDTSVDVYFGPEPPTGVPAANWIRTIPGKGWFTLLRLYGPLESWFEQTWRPGEIEPRRR